MIINKSKSAFKTIAEVADELGLATHVLRFWETKFSQIKPMKATGGRRYYRPDDVEIIKLIKGLLYNNRYTIEGAQQLIKEKGLKNLLGNEQIQKDFFAAPEITENISTPTTMPQKFNTVAIQNIEDAVSKLKSMRTTLSKL